MKKTSIIVLKLLISNLLFCQNWLPVADVNHQLVLSFLHDSVDGVLYIGGDFRYFNDLDAKGIVKWDGQTFTSLDDFPNSNCNDYNCNQVYSISKYKNEIYCTLTRSSWQDGIKGIGRWNGIQWDSIGSIEGIVYDQVIYHDDLYIMGRFKMLDNDSTQTMIKWDGENWYDVQFPYPYSLWPFWMSTISNSIVYDDGLYVAGNFFNDNETIVGIAKYDGTNWYSVAGGIKGDLDNVFDMEVYNNELYVCGSFRKSSGNIGNKIMKLVGEDWQEVSGGLDSESSLATKMLVYNDKLYVFGIFYSVGGGVPAQNIAVWDGERWCGIGTAFDESSIVDAVEFQGDLFICGGFDTIDGMKLERFARWTGGDYLEACGDPVSTQSEVTEVESIFSLSPNPAHTHLTLTNPSRQPYDLTLYNTAGQAVLSLRDGGGAGRMLDVSGLARGVYWCRFATGEGVFVEKLILH